MNATPRRDGLGSVAGYLRPRRWRLVGVSLGLLGYALLWVLEQAGGPGSHTPLLGVLVTVPALVVLIGGGNLLQGWLGIRRRSPQFAERDERPTDEVGSA